MNKTQQTIALNRLLIIFLPSFLIGFDVLAIGMLIHRFTEVFHEPLTVLQLIFSINAFVIAIGLMPIGAVSDRIGDRKSLLIGIFIFGITSLLIALSMTFYLILILRIIMAIGICFIFVGTLSIIQNNFKDKSRAKAMSLWAFSGGIGMVVSPIVAPFIIYHFDWQGIFLLNFFFVIISFILCFFWFKNQLNQAKKMKINILLYTLIFIWLTIFLIILILIPKSHYHHIFYALIISIILLTLILIFTFKRHIKTENYFYPLSYIQGAFLGCFGYFIIAVWVTVSSLWLNGSEKLNLTQIGLIMMSYTVMYKLAPLVASKLLNHIRIKPFTFFALIVTIIGFFLYFLISKLTNFPYYYMFSFTLIGIGCGLVNPFSGALALEKIPSEYAGRASGIILASKWVSASIGTTVTAMIWASVSQPLLILSIIAICLGVLSLFVLFFYKISK